MYPAFTWKYTTQVLCSRLAEREWRALPSTVGRRKTSSDHAVKDGIERRPVSLKASFTIAESSERCLSTPCSWNQTHRPFRRHWKRRHNHWRHWTRRHTMEHEHAGLSASGPGPFLQFGQRRLRTTEKATMLRCFDDAPPSRCGRRHCETSVNLSLS